MNKKRSEQMRAEIDNQFWLEQAINHLLNEKVSANNIEGMAQLLKAAENYKRCQAHRFEALSHAVSQLLK